MSKYHRPDIGLLGVVVLSVALVLSVTVITVPVVGIFGHVITNVFGSVQYLGNVRRVLRRMCRRWNASGHRGGNGNRHRLQRAGIGIVLVGQLWGRWTVTGDASGHTWSGLVQHVYRGIAWWSETGL